MAELIAVLINEIIKLKKALIKRMSSEQFDLHVFQGMDAHNTLQHEILSSFYYL